MRSVDSSKWTFDGVLELRLMRLVGIVAVGVGFEVLLLSKAVLFSRLLFLGRRCAVAQG